LAIATIVAVRRAGVNDRRLAGGWLEPTHARPETMTRVEAQMPAAVPGIDQIRPPPATRS
jgi:hypothetical protein